MLGTFIVLLVLCTIGWTAQPRNNRNFFPSANVSATTLLSIPQVTVYIRTTTTAREQEWFEDTPRTLSKAIHYALSNGTEITDREVQSDFIPVPGSGNEGPHERPRDLTSRLGSQPQGASRAFRNDSSKSTISESISSQIATNISPNIIASASASDLKTSTSMGSMPVVTSSLSSATNLPQSSTRITTIQIASSCILLYVIQDRDTCVSITSEFRLPLDTLFRLNSVLDAKCEHLHIGQILCLRDASSVSAGPPSTGNFAATTTPTMTRTTPTTAVATSSTATSLRFGGCDTYLVKAHDTCEVIATRNKLSLKDFLGLNPDLRVLGDGNCPIDVGQYVCVRGPSHSSALPTPTTQPEASSTREKTSGTPVSKGEHGTGHTPTTLEVVPIENTGTSTTRTVTKRFPV
ncbi:hypothetical protein SLS62_002436 [Diatrype stigma]|uniref:LysM domain-containing protein n=1 Tax=Diatrype stigma TaxID=117547 RepID=A0AAN9V6M7_9PEZI